MSDYLKIINPEFLSIQSPDTLFPKKNMIQFNKSSNVSNLIKRGKKYVIELPDTKTILHVECTGAAIYAADMKIYCAYIDGQRDLDSEDYTFSYQYEHFDSVHYTSFNYREKCILYASLQDLF